MFSPNAGKYGPENAPYLDTFQPETSFRNMVLAAVLVIEDYSNNSEKSISSPTEIKAN